MDYNELAVEFLKKMQVLRKFHSQKSISGALHGEAFVLHCIARQGEDVLPGEISHEMDVSSARIAAALNKLENKGLITRKIDKSDRRKILVCLTEEGRALTEKHQHILMKQVAGMLASLGEYDAKEYVRILGRLAETPVED